MSAGLRALPLVAADCAGKAKSVAPGGRSHSGEFSIVARAAWIWVARGESPGGAPRPPLLVSGCGSRGLRVLHSTYSRPSRRATAVAKAALTCSHQGKGCGRAQTAATEKASLCPTGGE
jgi:hypothetical protein